MESFDIRWLDEGARLADAHAVRRAVFIDEQGVSEKIEMDDKDPEARHVVAYSDGMPVGTGRLREPEPSVAKIERVAVRESSRGEGLGRALMYELEDIARADGMDEAVLHAQTSVEEFYEKLGYRTVSDTFDEAGIRHVEMRKGLVRDSWTC